jgi:hypothetical protein
MYEEGTILTLKEQRPPTLVDGPEVEEEVEVDVIGEDGEPTGEKAVEIKKTKTQVEQPFPYNRVRVIGPSFITYSRQRGSEDPEKEPYYGTDALGVIIVPESGFAATLDEPYGKLRRLYEIEQLPEPILEEVRVVKRPPSPSALAGPTPEEVFAGNQPIGDSAPRTAPNPRSPLEDPRPTAKRVSPLD